MIDDLDDGTEFKPFADGSGQRVAWIGCTGDKHHPADQVIEVLLARDDEPVALDFRKTGDDTSRLPGLLLPLAPNRHPDFCVTAFG